MTSRSTRGLAIVALAAPQFAGAQSPASFILNRYEVDPQHSSVAFTARMLGAVKVRGRFTRYTASIVFDAAHPEASSVTAIILTKSIETDMAFRDRHLRSPDFLDAERLPTIVFQSDRVAAHGTDCIVSGSLTIHGITRRVDLRVTEVLKPDTLIPSGVTAVAFETHIRLSRRDFGIAGTNAFNPSYDPASTLLADSVDVDLELYALRGGYRRRSFAGGAPRSIADTIAHVLASRGAREVGTTYAALRRSDSTAFNFSPSQLDGLGHQLLETGQYRDAIAVLRVNAQAFPRIDGVATSLGDALVLAGDVPGAIAAYQRELALNPSDATASEMLRLLRRGGNVKGFRLPT